MAQFILRGQLKLLLNSDSLVHCKHISGNKDCGLLGFGEFCSIYTTNINDKNVRRNAYSKKVTFIASARGNSRNSVNGEVINEDFRDEFDDDDDEYGEDGDLSCFRGLVLDIAYRPINVVCWKRAICLKFMEKTVSSPNGSFNIPTVLRVSHLLQVMKKKRVRNTLCRKNILYRDDYMCQYCKSTNNLTIDHVVPISQGGIWEWENLGHKTLEEAHVDLIKASKAPKDYNVRAIPLNSSALRMLKVRKGTPQEWHQYLP